MAGVAGEVKIGTGGLVVSVHFRLFSENPPQFVLRGLEAHALGARQVLAGPVHIEGQHRHGRAVGFGLAAPAALGGAPERQCDLLRILPGEDASFEVDGVRRFGDILGPTFAGLARDFFAGVLLRLLAAVRLRLAGMLSLRWHKRSLSTSHG
jgi:hypothetical protein